jgi:mannose-1-phosphate guanylyltransferase
MQPIILCGGFGRRLWPISQTTMPKQFIKLSSQLSLFQQTLIRLKSYKQPIIIGNIIHRDLIYKQMQEISIDGRVILEEKTTSTYIPVIFGMLVAQDNVLGIFPTDHFIQDIELFNQNIDSAINLLKYTKIVNLGIKAKSFCHDYGYISASHCHNNIYLAKTFVEKPKQEYLVQDGVNQYFWNSGISIFKADSFFHILKDDINIISSYLHTANEKKNFVITREIYDHLTHGSFDMLVMNKLTNFYMILADFEWMDIGSFSNMLLYYNFVNQVNLDNYNHSYNC